MLTIKHKRLAKDIGALITIVTKDSWLGGSMTNATNQGDLMNQTVAMKLRLTDDQGIARVKGRNDYADALDGIGLLLDTLYQDLRVEPAEPTKLLHNDVDDYPSCWGEWPDRPTHKELSDLFFDYYDRDLCDRLASELLNGDEAYANNGGNSVFILV